MYYSLSIRSFRSFEDFQMGDLGRVNILVGSNNVGKTSILEALMLLGGATNPMYPTMISQLRGQKIGESPDPVWRSLFHKLDLGSPIQIRGQWNQELKPRELSIEALSVSTYSELSSQQFELYSGADARIGGLRLNYISPDGEMIITESMHDPKTDSINAPSKQRSDFVRTTFLSARAFSSLYRDAEQFSHLVKIKQEEEVVEALKPAQPALKRLEVVSEGGGSTIYADLGMDSLTPLAVCGEGTLRLFSMAVGVTGVRGGVLLVDEIDNGLHYSVMDRFWRTLRQMLLKHDVQLFATTHNDELIHSALRAFDDDLSMLRVVRVDRLEESIRAVTYNEPALRGVASECFEVRG